MGPPPKRIMTSSPKFSSGGDASGSGSSPGFDPTQTRTPSADHLPYAFRHGGLTIEGYSRAAVQTFWRIPELKLGFDLGWQPWEYMGTPRWFISHTHMDHCLALPAYVVRRRMMRMTPPTIYVPRCSVADVQRLLDVYARLDRGKGLPCSLVGVEEGMELELSRELVVSVVKTYHSIPSVGYIVWERRKKLRPEYTRLSGPELCALKEKGVEITYEIRSPRVAYLGDSSVRGLDANPEMYEADILITEVTFAAPDPTPEKAYRYGHVHFDDIAARRDRFKNQVIIAGHFSTRITDRMIRRFIHKKCPDLLDGRLKIWLR